MFASLQTQHAQMPARCSDEAKTKRQHEWKEGQQEKRQPDRGSEEEDDGMSGWCWQAYLQSRGHRTGGGRSRDNEGEDQ